MSKTPRDRPVRKAASKAPQADAASDLYDDDYYDEDQEYIPQRQSRSRAQSQEPQRARQRSQQNYRPRSVPPTRNNSYTLILGTLGVLIFVGAVLIAYLLGSRSGSNSSSPPAAVAPTVAAAATDQTDDTYPEVPRMEVADFIKLYSDMSKRPYLIDVRAKDQYDQEHIKDAKSFPTDQIATHLSELPKDKLIVAYCA